MSVSANTISKLMDVIILSEFATLRCIAANTFDFPRSYSKKRSRN